jgi:POT family proton-dependent oligopeptide transporter
MRRVTLWHDNVMSTVATAPALKIVVPDAAADRSFFGHPAGLLTLFFTEMWERFSYYGMRAFLILYMTRPAGAGGLAFGDASATSLYGTYTGSAWAASILGGLVADRWLGQYRSVLLGGVVIMLGHVALVFRALPFFYTGLALIVIGTGLLKPSVSTMVGSLYDESDPRRDAGFSIFYMGINLGALIGPLVAGYIAERIDWHLGFGCAAVGMLFGIIQYAAGKKRLQPALDRIAAQPRAKSSPDAPAAAAQTASQTSEWKRISAIIVLFLFAILFWGGYEQAGSTLNLFADRYTRLEMFGFSFPASWFQSVQPIFLILFAPGFAWLWVRLGSRNPSLATKFALGLLFMGLSFLILLPAASSAQGAGMRVSPWWLVVSYAISELGELCLSPVGLSAVTRLAPVRIVGLMMGVWFLSLAFGNKLAGWAGGFIETLPLQTLFGAVAGVLAAAAVLMFLLVKPVSRLTGEA